MQLETLFTEMADALRTKEETTSKISAESFPQRIKDLKVLDTTDATATSDNVVAGKIAYANGKRIIGTIIDNGALEYTPSDEEQIIPTGLTSGGIIKAIDSKDLTITPSKKEQSFSGLYKDIIVNGDENLIAENIKAGISIFNIDGNLEVLDTSDATATAGDISKDKTAYVNGKKIVGTNNLELIESALEPTENNRKTFWRRVSKNLCDGITASGYLYTMDGTIKPSSYTKYTVNYIPVKANTSYVISTEYYTLSNSATRELLLYDANKKYTNINTDTDINWITWDNTLIVITPTKDGYIRIGMDNNCRNIMVEEGTVKTEYEEYFEPITYILNDQDVYVEIVDTSDGTATAEDIAKDKTAYVNGEKVVGTAKVSSENNTIIIDKTLTANGNTEVVDRNFINSIKKLNIGKISGSCYQLFQNLGGVEEIYIEDTSECTEMNRLFYDDVSLKTLNELDCGNVGTVNNMFSYCSSLENLGGFKNLGKAYKGTTASNGAYGLALSVAPNLTRESLLNVINGLYDLNISYNVANGGTLYRQDLTIGTTNIAKLTADEIAIATNKGWYVK